jgi:hypothetical protein
MKNGIAMISKLSRPVNSFSYRFRAHVGQREHEGQHGQAKRDRYRHARQHQSEQQDKHNDRAHALRQHNETGGVRNTDRHDQKRRQDQNDPQRAAFTVALLAPGNLGRVQSIGLDAVDMGGVVVR